MRRFRIGGISVLVAAAMVGASARSGVAQLPDHPIITEVYTDPPGATDGPVGRDLTNAHQGYIEIYLPPLSALNANFNKDAVRLTFYEVEGDGGSSGVELVNYRFDLPTFDFDPSNGTTSGAVLRPSSGIVVLGWVDYVGDPPTDLAGSPDARIAMIHGGITSTDGSYVFVAINGRHFTGSTALSFPTVVEENLIDIPNETRSGVIQNGSGAYLLVDRDSQDYVELCDDKHAVDCVDGADPDLPGGSSLREAALLDGFAGNDDSKFDVTDQPEQVCSDPPDECIDLQTVLPEGGNFSLLIPQIPEEDTSRITPTVGNGYARVFVDVQKTTEDGSGNPDPVVDATEAYRLIRNVGPFFPTPGEAPLTTSPPALGVAVDSEHVFEVLSDTTGNPGVLSANVGGLFGIDIVVSPGTSSDTGVATFNSGTGAVGVTGGSFSFPSVAITPGATAPHGSSASATVTVTATNSSGGEPAVVDPVRVVTVTATVLNPTTGLDASGMPFQATVFAAIQAVLADPAIANEFLATDVGAFLAAQPDISLHETLGNAFALLDSSIDISDPVLTGDMVKEFPDFGEECFNWLSLPGPVGRLDLVETVLTSAEVVSGTRTYEDSIAIDVTCVDPPSPRTVIKGLSLNIPDTLTFNGPFSPTDLVHFVDALGVAGNPRSGLSNASTSRTFELVLVDSNVNTITGLLETGLTDDFGVILEVATTETGSSLLPGEFVFLSFTGGLQGTDIDPLVGRDGGVLLQLIYLDLDNLHDQLGIRSIERVILVDGSGNGELDLIEAFSLNPSASTGCVGDAACSDGLFCTGVEVCVNSVCQPGQSVDCNDDVSCTVDSCNEFTDSCDHTPDDVLCDNTLFCDGVETCHVSLGCLSGMNVDCTDSNPCTTDSCNETTDVCDNALGMSCLGDGECDDGDDCTTDECCSGTCLSTPVAGCGCFMASPPELALVEAGAQGGLTGQTSNRVIALSAGDAGRTAKIRVTLVSLPPPWDVWNGTAMWVTQPREICELSGIGPNDDCPAGVGFFQMAGLNCDVAFAASLDWNALGTVYVQHAGIVPSSVAVDAQYVVQVIDETCDVGNELQYSPELAVVNSLFGDVSGPFDPAAAGGVGAWVAPDGSVDIVPDVLAGIAAFSNSPGNPKKTRADIEPCRLDFKINITDIVQLLDGFRSVAYSFAPGDEGCPLTPCGAG